MSHQIKNILEDTDSDKELKKEWQEQCELGKPRSKKARVKPRAETVADWQTKHVWLYEQGGKMFCRTTCLKHNKKKIP